MAQRPALLIQTAFVGDLLLSVPLLRHLRTLHPKGEIHLLCRKGLGSFFLLNDLVDKVFEIDKSENSKIESQDLSQMKSFDYKYIVCPHQSITSAKIVKSLKAEMKIGYKQLWNFWAFSRRLQRPMHLPEAMRQLHLLTSIDPELEEKMKPYVDKDSRLSKALMEVKPGATLPSWAQMSLPELSRQKLEEKLARDIDFHASMKNVFELSKKHHLFEKEVIFVAPGSVWPTKRWTISGYSNLCQTLRRRGYNVALIGAPDEIDIAQEIGVENKGVINLCGLTSLFETYLLFQKGKALVSNDSGAMHLASAAHLPAVSIFGPTTLDLGYRPWNPYSAVVEVPLDCRPCGKHGGEKCPISTHQCMKDINELMVLEKLDEVLSALK